MAEFPVTCSCGTEFIADDEGGAEIQCPTCGNRLRLEPEASPSPQPGTASYFRCPRCERPVEHERIFSCPRCGADLRPGHWQKISDDSFHNLVMHSPHGPPPPFYGRIYWILFRPTEFFRHVRFEEGFHSAGLFFLLCWLAVLPLLGVTMQAAWQRAALVPEGEAAEFAAIWAARLAALALPVFLLCGGLWATVAHLLGTWSQYQSDVGAMLRVGFYSAVPLTVALVVECLLVLVDSSAAGYSVTLPFLFWTLALQAIGVNSVSRLGPERSWVVALVPSALVAVMLAFAGVRFVAAYVPR